MQKDPANIYFELASRFVLHTDKHIFLTGKAGTGKTTFLKYIRANCSKKMAIVAPTGVAAINAGGVTLHTFFQLPLGAYVPQGGIPDSGDQLFNNRQTLLRNLRLSQQKKELIRELELLVIDEVSMMRADILDAIDAVLRHVRKKPYQAFGGVQVLFIGDLFQLPPVIADREWHYLKQHYASPFFFDAQVMQSAEPVYLELKKIYRQSEQAFISLLNMVRNNRLDKEGMEYLNSRYRPGFEPSHEEQFITLTTHNARADAINQQALQRLGGAAISFRAEISGEFSEKAYPADLDLHLKPGAQIMFIKNDKGEERRYYNGRIGKVHDITDERIRVSFADDGSIIDLEKEVWRNIRYQYDKAKDNIDEEELGTFSQYPIRLAWAITIHKSQGLSFDKAIIDAGAAFAPGQVYVALSRLTNMEGLVLRSRVPYGAINTDPRVLAFSSSEKATDALEEELARSEKHYIRLSLLKAFHLESLQEMADNWVQEAGRKSFTTKTGALEWALHFHNQVNELMPVAAKTVGHLESHLQLGHTVGYNELVERTRAASGYFVTALMKIIENLRSHIEGANKASRATKYLKELGIMEAALLLRVEQLKKSAEITAALASGASDNSLLGMISSKPEPVKVTATRTKQVKGGTQRISLEMFMAGNSISEIAESRQLAYSTIHGHLSRFVAQGELPVELLIEKEKLATILQAVEKVESRQWAPLREVLGDEFSYPDIQAVLAHLNYLDTVKGNQTTEASL
ncbi:helix-turn-helix domain-containing protein [Flavihumibacter sp. ZG627]|uniref:helix-turn-helix domain-containing protein n=1 Tax=Flavihumibacter sp. ZG627 TaxID=1463156 RepID=UPI00057FEA91|nr:helix-turn-helix domain-containing protein [Flavihumibacter sp. ZG627]KIC90932.1 hypothetical protein HY58_07815 [Flavihumibacter sp. ZG627]